MDSQPFAAPIDAAMLKRLVRAISSVGSHRLGFRAAGTPEDVARVEGSYTGSFLLGVLPALEVAAA